MTVAKRNRTAASAVPAARKATLIVKNIGQLVTMAGDVPRRGKMMQELGIIESGGIAVSNGEIIGVGTSDEIERKTPLALNCRVLDGMGCLVTPGLIDCHTHPVFANTRESEFEMRLQGLSYMEIAQAGGGIRSSVRDLRAMPADTLMQKTRKRFDRLLAHGTTTIEAKSGYGLSTESELKSLQVIRDLKDLHPLETVPTFLGAHEVPDEYRSRREAYVELVVNEMIPAVAKAQLAEFSDVFCEEGVFSIDESRRIQQAAKEAGLKLRFHADEFQTSGAAELAVEMGAVSADHLMFVSETGIRMLSQGNTVAVLLPGTTFSLGGNSYAPARRLIESGAVIALSTDCNPGSSCTESLPAIMTLAAVNMKLTAAETMSAVTVNAAVAIDRAGSLGQLVVGKQADFVLWDAADYRELPYHYGVNLAVTVIKNGKVVAG